MDVHGHGKYSTHHTQIDCVNIDMCGHEMHCPNHTRIEHLILGHGRRMHSTHRAQMDCMYEMLGIFHTHMDW